MGRRTTSQRADGALRADKAACRAGRLRAPGTVTEADWPWASKIPSPSARADRISGTALGDYTYGLRLKILASDLLWVQQIEREMSAAQRRCQTLLLQGMTRGLKCYLQSHSSLLTRLTGLTSSSATLQLVQPIVSLVPQAIWLDSWSARSLTPQPPLFQDRPANGQGLFPRVVQTSLSQQAGASGKSACVQACVA